MIDDDTLFLQDQHYVVEELNNSGLKIFGINDLVSVRVDYREYINVIIELLQSVQSLQMKDALIRALSVPWARKTRAAEVILEEFYKPNFNESVRWVVGNAIEVIGDDDHFEEIKKIIQNDEYGYSRQMFVLSLFRMKKNRDEAIQLAIEALPKEKLTGHALQVLRKMTAVEAKPYFEQYVDHKHAWYRREAKKGLEKLTKKGLI